MVFQLISRRYERGSVICTSNKAFGEWGSVFGDDVLSAAILDRFPSSLRGDDLDQRAVLPPQGPPRRHEGRCAPGVSTTRRDLHVLVYAPRHFLLTADSLIEAVYSANGGGVSATPIEGFGADFGEFPYLRSAPYPTVDPSPWTVRLELRAFAAQVGYRGQATGVRVSQAGPSGRALEVTVDGDAGSLAVPGLRFVEVLGLRSSLFPIRVGDAAVVGPPDPGEPSSGIVGELRPPEAAPARLPAPDRRLGRSPWPCSCSPDGGRPPTGRNPEKCSGGRDGPQSRRPSPRSG